MLHDLLGDFSDTSVLCGVLTLLSLSDNRVLWDGVPLDEITPDVDLTDFQLEDDPKESAYIMSVIVYNADSKRASHVSEQFIEALKEYPVFKLDSSDVRVKAAKSVLREVLGDVEFVQPSAPKVILYEMFLLAMRDGKISEVESEVIREFQRICGLDDCIYDDLLERAELLTQEIAKTVAIVLE